MATFSDATKKRNFLTRDISNSDFGPRNKQFTFYNMASMPIVTRTYKEEKKKKTRSKCEFRLDSLA